MSVMADVTEHQGLLDRLVRGETQARDRLLALHYQEFRKIARRVLREDAATLQIQPTELAHEAALRILKLDRMDWQDRTHFLATAARVMRQTLLDEIRRHRARKRQPQELITAWIEPGGAPSPAFDMEAFDGALSRLGGIDGDRARVVELRFYAGLTLEEVALATGASESTVKRRWRGARAWLLKEMGFA